MSHFLIAPILTPCLIAVFILFGMHRDFMVTRIFSILGGVLYIGIALYCLDQAAQGAITHYAIGGWVPPFGIVLVLDRLSAVMLLLTSIIAFFVLLQAKVGIDQKGRHFHSLIHLQVMGLNGAFLTGDLFNLFVFFEILLIASYALMVHGGGDIRIKAGVQYVVINLVGSSLFLIGIAIIYGMTGTLNMAHIAQKVAEAPIEAQGLLRVGGLLLLVVFGMKAALVPLQFWLPNTYTNTAAPMAALFAILTKVGAYSIFRVFTQIFGAETGWMASHWLLSGGILTLVIGTLGLLSASNLRQLVSFAVIASMGTIAIPLSAFSQASLASAIYYMIHSTLLSAALFLFCDELKAQRGEMGDRLVSSKKWANREVLAAVFFALAIAMTGMPPLSGFIGKLAILKSTDEASIGWVWSSILIMSLFSIIGFARAGSQLFWKTDSASESINTPAVTFNPQMSDRLTENSKMHLFSVLGLLLLSLLMTALAEPLFAFFNLTAEQLLLTNDYLQILLPENGGLQ